MRIIVDANIIFSAILNTNGKIGDLLLNSHNIFEFRFIVIMRTYRYICKKNLISNEYKFA